MIHFKIIEHHIANRAMPACATANPQVMPTYHQGTGLRCVMSAETRHSQDARAAARRDLGMQTGFLDRTRGLDH